MAKPVDEAAERRDAVLRRMLATPKPGKGEKKDGKPKPAAPSRPVKRRKPVGTSA